MVAVLCANLTHRYVGNCSNRFEGDLRLTEGLNSKLSEILYYQSLCPAYVLLYLNSCRVPKIYYRQCRPKSQYDYLI